MNPRNLVVVMCALCLMLTVSAAAVAGDDDRPHHGKVISIDTDAMQLVVQGEKDDQWTLYWTQTTKLQGDLTIEEVKVGDKVHFNFVQKEDKMWLTELRRTAKAKD